MKLAIETQGNQDKMHCSESSSIGACNYMYETLQSGIERCRLFSKVLEYDWDYHAYKRCEKCLKAEIKKEVICPCNYEPCDRDDRDCNKCLMEE